MEKSGTVEENRTAPDSRRQRLLSIMAKLYREINGTLRFESKFFRQSGPPPAKVPSIPRAGSSGVLPHFLPRRQSTPGELAQSQASPL